MTPLKSISFYLLTFVTTSQLLFCQEKKDSKDVDFTYSILQDSLSVKDLKKNVFVISTRGCPVCNKQFLEFVNNLNLSNATIITSNSKLQLDLNSDNQIVYDYRELLFRYDIIGENSAFIKLNNYSTDTILNVTLKSLDSDQYYIRNVLKMTN